MRFDRVIIADWSASNLPTSAVNRANSIWIGCHDDKGRAEWHHRTRATAEGQLRELATSAVVAGERLLVGLDFAFGYPRGFAARLTGQASAPSVWAHLATLIEDAPDNRNNRFAVAARLNASFPEGDGPFWSHPSGQNWPGLPARRSGIDHVRLGLAERRMAETHVPSAKSPFMLFNPGSVGSQSLLGMPLLHRLSRLPGVGVWPFAGWETSTVVLAEVYPSLLSGPVAVLANAEGLTTDEAQVRLLSRALWRLDRASALDPLLSSPPEAQEEGWILGANDPGLLHEALTW